MALNAQRPIDADIFNQETDPTPVDQTYLLVDHPSWPEPKKILFPLDSVDNGILLGGELITASGWTATGWTGNESIGWTHIQGNTTALQNVLAANIGSTYQIVLTVSNRTTGTFVVSFGGDTSPTLNSSINYSLTATTNGNFQIAPSSDFNGTILISIKEVTWELTKQELLDILEVDSLYSQSEIDALLALKVDKVTGKSLLADTEIARLLTIKGNPYKMSMPAGDIATKVAGAIFSPTGWGTVAQSGSTNIIVTSVLTGRKARFVNVFEIDGGIESWLSIEKGQAYTAFKNTGALTTLLEGFAPTLLPIEAVFIFD